MRERAVLTIDLGSAYTKLAVREGENSETRLLARFPFAPQESSFCVPSVIARVRNLGRDQWVMGLAAARQVPADNVNIWQNWKASLFLGLPSTSVQGVPPRDIARTFFALLLQAVEQYDSRLISLPIRICVPKLSGAGAATDVAAIACEAGWKLAHTKQVYEPETNIIGLLSRGRNVSQDGHPQHQEMFERSFFGPLRVLLDGPKDEYGFLVTDIGAFTTDFGYVRIDRSFWNGTGKGFHVAQQSYPLGIRQLDAAISEKISERGRAALNGASAELWDSLKPRLYRGEPIGLTYPGGGVATIGEREEMAAVVEAIAAFGGKVRIARKAFLTEQGIESIHVDMLTGGGSFIPGLRKSFADGAKESGSSIVYDLLDADEPRRFAQKRSISASPREIELRAKANQELVRGGSAIGGCSVFLS